MVSKKLWGHVLLFWKWSDSAHVHPDSYMKNYNNTKKWANNDSTRLIIYLYVFRRFLKLSFQCWVLIFDMFFTWGVGGNYYFRELVLQPHDIMCWLEARNVLSETCIEFIIILLSIQRFTSSSSSTGNMFIKVYGWTIVLLVYKLD